MNIGTPEAPVTNGHTNTETVPVSPTGGPFPRRVSDLLPEWMDEATANYEANQSGQPRGATTGIPSLVHGSRNNGNRAQTFP
jgi:hypothetical protein